MVEPTPEQEAIREEQQLGLLVRAPAGCGKTEALALRAAGLLERRQIEAPRRLLVLTFSNKARDNARARLASHLSPRQLRTMVTVSNLHGLAGRIVKAHGEVIGLSPDLELPTSDWVGAQCRSRSLSFPQQNEVKGTLRGMKQMGLTDAEILADLEDGLEVTLEIEQERQNEGILTYDDLPRLAELILKDDAVAALYRQHFGAVIVDEFQDLTLQQLRIIQRIGHGRTTYAGDIAQGIYSFAGAAPEQVLERIRKEVSVEIPLTESYRSSPAVLAVVNELNGLTDGAELRAAHPKSWPGGGLAYSVVFNDVQREAMWVVERASDILDHAPSQRVGVIARTAPRRETLDAVFAATDLPVRRWDDPLLDAATSTYMKKVVGQIDVRAYRDGGLDYLVALAQLDAIEEPDTRGNVVDTLGWVAERLDDGEPLERIASRIKTAGAVQILEAPGIHLLSGHVGKGQQFDWVFVVGLEDGVLPNFNAKTTSELKEEARVFSVMLSRARHGLAITRCEHIRTKAGKNQYKQASRFLDHLEAAEVLGDEEAASVWFATADWAAIAAR
jgi:DNA helicase II / ATP-dependent DNA helicase PcrA